MHRAAPAAFLALLLCAGPASAQEYSDDELLQLFLRQRDALREAQADPLGQTRSLRLVTVEDVAAQPPAEGADTPLDPNRPLAELPSEPPGGTPPATTVEVAQPPANEPLVFAHMEPDLQINVRVEFGFDSAALEPTERPKLAQLCKVMRESDIALFRIVGHTDGTGSDAYNERLSLLRAQEVQRHLVNDCGIAPNRLEAVGLGKRFLFDPDNPRSGTNRRVEFQALG